MTVRVNRPQAYELELLCCYQNILKQNPTEEKRVNKNVLEPIISSSQFSERWNIFLIFRIQCQCKDHIQRSRDVPFQEVGSVPRRGVGVAQQVGLMLVLLPVHWRPVSWWLLRGRHLAPLCWGRSSCPRASLPLASLLQGCERGGVCSADAGSWSQFTPPTPPRPAIAAGRWGRLCQCFLGHCSCFWWFPVPAAQSPLWTLGQAALGLGQGWLCPLLQERDRNWPENWVSMLSTITYIQGFDSLCYVVTAGFLFSFFSLSPLNVFTYWVKPYLSGGHSFGIQRRTRRKQKE